LIDLKIPFEIDWGDFLDNIVDPSRSGQESCAWIFIDVDEYKWHVLEVTNVGLKDQGETRSERIEHSFAPDKNDFARVKRIAKKNGWTKFGCIHTHVVISSNINRVKYQMQPSDADLKYARKFNDIVRGIIVVQFVNRRKKGKIYGYVWFDQFGKILEKWVDTGVNGLVEVK